jgi:predicted DNA-binding antitoxin AbrB/MazE fold protein
MNESVEAIFENGVFRPLSPVDLPEGEHVHLKIVPSQQGAQDPAYRLSDLAEETGISDLATNIDHYLYGLPKQKDE